MFRAVVPQFWENQIDLWAWANAYPAKAVADAKWKTAMESAPGPSASPVTWAANRLTTALYTNHWIS